MHSAIELRSWRRESSKVSSLTEMTVDMYLNIEISASEVPHIAFFYRNKYLRHEPAIGTPQELKSRHGAEFQLDIKISASATEAATSDLNVPDRVEQFVLSHMPGATMDSSHGNSLRFLVPSAAVYGLSGGLGAAFDVLESSRAELGIAEFSLSQTTLEQVFLRVAKADREAEEGPPN